MSRKCLFPRASAMGAALIAAAVSFGANSAFAHSFLVEAAPSSKEHVTAPPKVIKLRFGGGVEPAYSNITVEGADGKVVAEGSIGKADAPRELSVEAPALAPGRYVVRYRVLSTDGHIVQGNYEFTVDAP